MMVVYFPPFVGLVAGLFLSLFLRANAASFDAGLIQPGTLGYTLRR
jgi:hypothetical protein